MYNELLLNQQISQLSQRQVMYQWQKFPETEIPSGIDDSRNNLPADEQFGIVKNIDFTAGALDSVANLKLAGLFVTADNLHAYEVLADKLGGEKKIYEAGRWTTDVEFGRQNLMMNPIIIRKCEDIPPNFLVTNELVQPFLQVSS